MLTRTQLISNIEALEKQGASQQEVQEYINSVQIQREQPQKQVGGVQSFVQGIASPFLRTAVTGVGALGTAIDIGKSLYQKATGRDEEALKTLEESKRLTEKLKTEGANLGYFGQVKPLGSIKEGVGAGVEMGSWLIPGSLAVKTAQKGLVGSGLNLLKQFGITGATSGGLMGLGSSLQDAEAKPMDVAYSTLFGTVTGGVGGVGLGGLGVVGVKGLQTLRKVRSIQALEESLSKGYQKIFNPTARQVKIDTRFGGDSFKFAAQEMPDMPISVNKDGRVVADDAIELARSKYQAEASAYKPIIRNSGKFISEDDMINSAIKAAREGSDLDGKALEKAEIAIREEIEAYIRTSKPNEILIDSRGKRFVDISRVDDIKSNSWNKPKLWGSPDAEVWNDVNSLVGHALKDLIEKELPDAPVKAMNRRLGQWKSLIDMLEKRNGQVSGSGGKLAKYIIRSVGTSVGAGAGRGEDGGFGGALGGGAAGYLTAEMLAMLFANPNVKLYILRQLIKRLQKAGQKDLIQQAQRILNEQASKYLLPPRGGTSFKEPVIPVFPKTGGQLDYIGRGNVVIPQSRLSNSTIAQPTKAPAIVAKKVSIPKSTTKPSPQSSLLTEAKKYKSAEEFVKDIQQKSGRVDKGSTPTLIFAEKRGSTFEDLYKVSPERLEGRTGFKTPPKTVKVYRGVRDNKFNIQVGDYVTTDKAYAQKYGKIIKEMEIPAEDLRYMWGSAKGNQLGEFPEYVYYKTKSQLTDIWKKANGK